MVFLDYSFLFPVFSRYECSSVFLLTILKDRNLLILHLFFSLCFWYPGEHVTSRFKNEVERMGFDMNNAWRISNINEKYK